MRRTKPTCPVRKSADRPDLLIKLWLSNRETIRGEQRLIAKWQGTDQPDVQGSVETWRGVVAELEQRQEQIQAWVDGKYPDEVTPWRNHGR